MTRTVHVTRTTPRSLLSSSSAWNLCGLGRSGCSQRRDTGSLPAGSLLSSSWVYMAVSLGDGLRRDAQFPVPAIISEDGRGLLEREGLQQGLEGGFECGIGSRQPSTLESASSGFRSQLCLCLCDLRQVT